MKLEDQFPWTDERIDVLKARFIKGDTAGEIADYFNITRNAVCGKLARLNLFRKIGPRPSKIAKVQLPRPPSESPKSRARRAPSMPEIKAFRPAKSFTRRYRARREPVMVLPAPVSENVPLLDRTGCAFPVNDGAPFLFCNAVRDEPKSAYCAHHRQRMFTSREKAA